MKYMYAYPTGGDYDICPYASLSVSGKQQIVSSSGTAADYSLHLRTFSQRDCGDSAPRRTSTGRSISNSPPDGLNLGSLRRPLDRARDRDRIWARSEAQHLTDLSLTEISCISSQQTLPLSDVGKGRAGPGRGRSRSRCGPSDSDSGGKSPRRRQYRVPTPSHRSEAFPSGDRDSSSDSADASPELTRRVRRPVRSGSSASGIVTTNLNGGCRRGVLR